MIYQLEEKNNETTLVITKIDNRSIENANQEPDEANIVLKTLKELVEHDL